MRYCMYLRKSRADLEAESHGEGETLARHESVLLALAKKQQLNVTQIYREIVSGETIASRPVMQKLLGDAEQGIWAGVLVVEVERLARGDTIDQGIVAQTFKYSGTKIITPTKTYDPNNEFDEEYFEFGLFMSRREYKTINRRLQSGRAASVREGKYVGSRPPYGYLRKKLESEKGYTLVPNPEQAPVVQMIYNLYTLGERAEDGTHRRLGASLIAKRLNALFVKPARGDSWVTPSVRDILGNPVYMGKIRWNFRPGVKHIVGGTLVKERPRNTNGDCIVVDGLHEAIVSEKTFDLAQAYRTQNPRRPLVNSKSIKNPLAGLVVCGKCGRRMTRRPYGGKSPDTLICCAPACDNVSSALELVESRLLTSLERLLESYKVTPGVSEAGDNAARLTVRASAMKNLECDIRKSEGQLSSVHDLLEQKVYTAAEYLNRSKILKEKLGRLNQMKAALQHELEAEGTREKSRKTFIPRLEHLLTVYRCLPGAQEKNEMLREVLEKVVYTKTVNGRWHAHPDDFELVLYPKLPIQREDN